MTEACPFCGPDPGGIAFDTDLANPYWDAYPVSTGHLLVIQLRHIVS